MGKAVAITRMDYTAPDLRGLAAQSDDADQTRRLLATPWLWTAPHGLTLRARPAWTDRRCAIGFIATMSKASTA